jgi:Flp pilus assembly protein TadD
MAAALARQGQLDRAGRELGRVLESDPENVAALTNLGLILVGQGAAARGRPYLEEALRLEPGLSVAREALAALNP